jgi:hypothetical protein
MSIVRTYNLYLLSSIAVVGIAAIFPSETAVSKSKTRVLTLFVRQDFSDCSNANVVAGPANVGGEAMVTRRDANQTEVNVRLNKVAANTTYHLYLKCVKQIGDIKTDSTGSGNNTFMFPTNSVGAIFAFDMYPDGAPAGNKYQSVQVNFN